MKRYLLAENPHDQYELVVLVKDRQFISYDIKKYLFKPFGDTTLQDDQLIAYSLLYNENNKTTATLRKAYLEDLLPIIDDHAPKAILCCDSEYFKQLTKLKKADPYLGEAVPCAFEGFEHFTVFYAPNHARAMFDPQIIDKLNIATTQISGYLQGQYKQIGTSLLTNALYPKGVENIRKFLNGLHKHPILFVDIETYSLKFYETGIGTIGFAWNTHEAGAFQCDPSFNLKNTPVRKLLKKFFTEYTGKIVFHNANFDMKIIINSLWMEDLLDEQGKQEGIQVMTRNFHDTKLIAYHALNSTTGVSLGLKDLAFPFAGNYAIDVKDITKQDIDDVLHYNAIDCISTAWVFEKYFPIMQADKQEDLYENIFKPSVAVILQMELTGMPLNMANVIEAEQELKKYLKESQDTINQHPKVQEALYLIREKAKDKANEKLKTIQKSIADFEHIDFNPNSNQHVITLLHTVLDLPVLDKTPTGMPSVGNDTLEKIYAVTDNEDAKKIILALQTITDANKILTTYITAFKNAVLKSDGVYYLHGSFVLGGTKSARLSSKEPNLQNIPSGSRFAKAIKKCFQAPPGYLFVGADFASLEDRISALTSKDPAKLKVYEDGFDGHCLRAYYYFSDQMPDIDPNCVNSVNSIKTKYPSLRQDSKAPTFLLTYGGTFYGLMSNCGFDEKTAKQIEKAYHDMYKVSDEWVAKQLKIAESTGYVECAFGHRLRTPLLAKCIMGESKTPYEAKAESRTAGNALGQSYGLLNNRAAIELQERCFNSPYRYDIKPIAHIHDAQYFIIKNDMDVLTWLNTHLPECMAWQNLPAIQHPNVKLSGELDVFYPTWAESQTLPSYISEKEIYEVLVAYVAKLREKALKEKELAN